jgi:hypothetical protein
MMMTNSARTSRQWLLSLGAVAALSGCGANTGSTEDVGSTQAEILNGDAVASADVNVMLYTPVDATSGKLCSGTLLNDRWLVTAKHCSASVTGPTTRLTRGSDTRTAVAVVNHPTLDISLVQASSAFPNVYQTSMYPWDKQRLVNQNVTCYGYGLNSLPASGAGTLRQGSMLIVSADDELVLVPADSRNQISAPGDSGGGCFLNNKSRALLGVAESVSDHRDASGNLVSIEAAYYIPTSAFSQWALPIIGDPSSRLFCNGRECVTNPRPLPNNVGQEVAWQPCPGQLTAFGNFSFDYEMTYDMELNYDKILVDGSFVTGAGTKTGTTSASQFGHRLGVYTDFSVQSQGISWLRARCPNDP